MTTIRKLAALATLLIPLVASGPLSGCKKDDSKGKAGIAALGGKSGLGIIPRDADALGGINLAKVVASDLWKGYGTMAMIAVATQFEEFKKTCGMDPLTTIESIVAAGTLEREDGVIVIKGMPRQTAISCAKNLAAQEGEQLTITEDGNLTRAVDSKGVVTNVGWLDDKTMLLAAEARHDKGKMASLMNGKSGFDGNQDMMDLLGRVDTTAALWGVARNTQGRRIGPLGGVAAYGSVKLDAGLQIDAGLRQDSADKARAVADEIHATLKGFKGSALDKLVAKVKVETQGSDVVVAVSLTSDEIQALVEGIMENPDMQKLLDRLMP